MNGDGGEDNGIHYNCSNTSTNEKDDGDNNNNNKLQ